MPQTAGDEFDRNCPKNDAEQSSYDVKKVEEAAYLLKSCMKALYKEARPAAAPPLHQLRRGARLADKRTASLSAVSPMSRKDDAGSEATKMSFCASLCRKLLNIRESNGATMAPKEAKRDIGYAAGVEMPRQISAAATT